MKNVFIKKKQFIFYTYKKHNIFTIKNYIKFVNNYILLILISFNNTKIFLTGKNIL